MPAAKKEDAASLITTNMRFYTRIMTTPKEAQRPFNNGRFSGTDINPMWRIQKLTEIFGPAGQGWWTQNEEFSLVPFEKTGEIAVFCTVELVYVDPETKQESKPIKGVGGNMFVTQRKTGLQLNDEAYKSAYTDALSIACKALGFSHDIYFANDRTKYTENMYDEPVKQAPKQEKPQEESAAELQARIQRGITYLTKDKTADQKKDFLKNVIVPAIGQEDYRSCTDTKKLTELLTTLQEMSRKR